MNFTISCNVQEFVHTNSLFFFHLGTSSLSVSLLVILIQYHVFAAQYIIILQVQVSWGFGHGPGGLDPTPPLFFFSAAQILFKYFPT